MDDAWEALTATPFEEVRRRAAIVSELCGIEPAAVNGAQRFGWRDAGNVSTAWYFLPDRRALLLTFDPVADLSVSWNDYAGQEALYGEVPDDLVALTRDRRADKWPSSVIDTASGRTLHWACGVFWFDDQQWRPAEGLLDHCDDTGIDPIIGSTFTYCLDVYRFGQPFPAPSQITADRRFEWTRYAAGEAESLAAVEAIYTRHGHR